MSIPGELTISCPTEAMPLTPHKTYDFITELEDFTRTVYEDRAELVENEQPLLQNRTTTRYEETELGIALGYSIDARNIYKWVSYFQNEAPAPTAMPTEIVFDVTENDYSVTGDILTLNTTYGDLDFRFDPTETDLSGTVDMKYNTQTQTFEVMPEVETLSVTMEDEHTETFPSGYDAYQYTRTADVATHQPFAVYSPLVDATQAKEWATARNEDNIVITTDDEWKVCVRSPDEMDPRVEVTLIELLPNVTNTLQEHYDSFAYPAQFIFVPELQYLHQVGDAVLSDAETDKMKTAPYFIPYGNEEALFEKVSFVSAQETTGQFDIDEVGYGHLTSLSDSL